MILIKYQHCHKYLYQVNNGGIINWDLKSPENKIIKMFNNIKSREKQIENNTFNILEICTIQKKKYTGDMCENASQNKLQATYAKRVKEKLRNCCVKFRKQM